MPGHQGSNLKELDTPKRICFAAAYSLVLGRRAKRHSKQARTHGDNGGPVITLRSLLPGIALVMLKVKRDA